MKFLFATVIVAAIGVSAIPNPQTDVTDERLCLAVCREVKPVCPVGEAPTGSEGCWGCCQPIKPPPTVCAAVCRPTRPICPYGQVASGVAGCWGCCGPIPTRTPIPLPTPIPVPTPKPTPCLAVCQKIKPICPLGQAPSGSEGCWGCCQPAPRVCTLECRLEKPACPVGEAPTGSEGCWGCCQPINTF